MRGGAGDAGSTSHDTGRGPRAGGATPAVRMPAAATCSPDAGHGPRMGRDGFGCLEIRIICIRIR
jgi:hypothetical protein